MPIFNETNYPAPSALNSADRFPMFSGADSDLAFITRAQLFDLTTVATQRILLPQNDAAATPTLGFGDTGFYENAANSLSVAVAGAGNFFWQSNIFAAFTSTGPALLNEVPSATNPVLVPRRNNLVSGIGSPTTNEISVIANSVEVARFNTAATGVNYVDLTPAATGADPVIAAAGSDTDVALELSGKGTGGVSIDEGTADNGFIDFKATIDGDATSAISSFTTSGATTHHIQIELNGVTAWIAVSTTDPTA